MHYDSKIYFKTLIINWRKMLKKMFFEKKFTKIKKRGTEKNVDRESSDGGFTFVETLAVLAIGAILTAGVGVSAFKAIEIAREYSAKETISQYKAALQSYYIDCGSYPSTEQGLQALWEKPTLVPVPESWQGPYLDKEIKKDPWGGSYIYVKKGSASFPAECPGSLPYAIICYGADGISGGEGRNADILSWR